MFFGGIFMWAFWLLLIVLIIVIIKALAGGNAAPGPSGKETPMEILKHRYARGEIDEQEFERRRRELEQ